MKIAVTDNPQLSRYEIRVDGVLAGFEDYRIGDSTVTLVHTEVLQQFEGQGLAGHLVDAILDEARSRSLRVRPRCRYVRSYLARHPEYGDLVDSDRACRGVGVARSAPCLSLPPRIMAPRSKEPSSQWLTLPTAPCMLAWKRYSASKPPPR